MMFSIQEHTTKYLGNRSLPELETAALLTQVQQATAPWTQKAQDGIRRLRHAINKIQKKEGIPVSISQMGLLYKGADEESISSLATTCQGTNATRT